MSNLQTPPTEIEIADLISVVSPVSPKWGLVIRRLTYQRDQLSAEIERLRLDLAKERCRVAALQERISGAIAAGSWEYLERPIEETAKTEDE